MIGRSGERGSGISVLAARHDDDDDISGKNRGCFCFIVPTIEFLNFYRDQIRGVLSLMDTIIWNEIGNQSSNPAWGSLHFTLFSYL